VKNFLDMSPMTEDQRIKIIAEALNQGKVVGFVVDLENGNHEKGDRYLQKLEVLCPAARVTFRGDGPVNGVESIKVVVVQ
jgi:hypothetical protein